MKIMNTQPQESRTPILDTYRTVFKSIADQPDVRRIISLGKKLICINLAARPGAKIDKLMP